MISNPLETRRIAFLDWDDRVIGAVVLPAVVRDARPFVNFFAAVNLIHPELNGGMVDEWAAEREEKYAQAVHDWPRNEIYPEEAWYFAPGKDGWKICHSLRYLPGARKRINRLFVPFRPKRAEQKEAEIHG